MLACATDVHSVWSNSSESYHNFEFSSVHFGLCGIKEENEDNESIPSSRLRGWGSDESRTSYQCLTSLVTEDEISPRQVRCQSLIGEGWGYFVDTKDSE